MNTDEESIKKLSTWISEINESSKLALQVAEHGGMENNGTTMAEKPERLKEDICNVRVDGEERETKLSK